MAFVSQSKSIASTLSLLALLCVSVPIVMANEQTHPARSEEDVEVLSLVVASEINEQEA